MSAQARPPVETYYDGIASDLTTVHRELAGLAQEVGGLGGCVEALDEKIDRNQALIIELLTQLVGRSPDAG
ncbi:hypothetical protein OG906_34740 (plasmid) [Streptomyces sp. NBC_01426]|uniref:hypothetical protein n=1 Tax=Streptomyces sp. NBC_01426 TaxID=2975866 RepID=UPI002E361E86|nr:hypothetical protein [Streptomyces sp. NBC_01426]